MNGVPWPGEIHGRACAPSLAAGNVYGLAYLIGYPRHGKNLPRMLTRALPVDPEAGYSPKRRPDF